MNASFVWPGGHPAAFEISRCAVRALYAELVLEPKPGLVSCRDNGSHTDMSARTLFKSLFALRHYFGAMVRAGLEGRALERLQALGLSAEARMLGATGGVNTHKGSIFSLGLLCAAAGLLVAEHAPLTADNLRSALIRQWGDALSARATRMNASTPTTNGQRVAQRFRLRGALDEAAQGFPTLFNVALPALQEAIARGRSPRSGRVHCLFATMVALDDTNLVHRGGIDGMRFVKARAAAFMASGSVWQDDWLIKARHIHSEFVERKLSPGGAADLLACACWVVDIQRLAAGNPPIVAGSNDRAVP